MPGRVPQRGAGGEAASAAACRPDIPYVTAAQDPERSLYLRAQGVAALERARGETAALRGLVNAAMLAAENPALLQLRLLEQLGTSAGHTVIIGRPPAPVT